MEEVWGVGRRVAARLSAAGIRTAFDLARADDAWIRRRFSVTLWNTALELRGVSAVPDGDPGSIRQTLVVSRSFGHRITRKDLLMEAISAFTVRALERLRGERLVARGFSVHAQTSLFEKDGVYANSATVNLPFPSADTALFLKKARGALNAIWKPGYRYARGGVMLFSVEREDRRELSLLAPQKDGKKQARLMKAMDDINARYDAFANAEASLINNALVVPMGMSIPAYIATRLNYWEGQYASTGFSNKRLKGIHVLDHYISMSEYEANRDAR